MGAEGGEAPPPEIRLRIDAALARGAVDEAAALAEQALAQGFEHPALLNAAAYAQLKAGAPERALAFLERARSLAPEDAHVLNSLGTVLKRLGRLDEALAALDAAAAAAPSDPLTQYHRGLVFEAIPDNEAARAAYERAVAVAPGHAEALGRLSFLAALRGDYDTALACARRAVERSPGGPSPELRLARFALTRGDYEAAMAMATVALARTPAAPDATLAVAHAELGLGRLEAARSRALAVSGLVSAPPDARALALWLAAEAEDRSGDTEAAFAHYAEAQAVRRRHHAAAFAPPHVPYPVHLARALRYFETARAADLRNAAPPREYARPHLFVLGFMRSGTTVLQHALAAHPDVVTAPEMDPFPQAVERFFLAPGGWSELARLDEAALARYRESYWRLVYEAAPAARGKVYIDKNPMRTAMLPIVAKLFPQAKILFCVRDPRDVVMSVFRQHFAMNPVTYEFTTLEGIARVYDAMMRLAALYREKLPLSMMTVRHEELAAAPERVLRQVCDFSGLLFDEKMCAVESAAHAVPERTPNAWRLRGGLRPQEGHWRRYREALLPVMNELAPWVARFSYPAY